MKKKNIICFSTAIAFLILFVLWTAAVAFISVEPIGPNGSGVGLAAMNGAFHKLTGVHMTLYEITDWMGLFPISVMLGFFITGLVQLIKRKSFMKVDPSLYVLGETYLLLFAVYMLFERVVINYRPVLIDGRLEASYPSSTTLLVMTVIPTAMIELRRRIKNNAARMIANGSLAVFLILTAVGRTLSGVHWLTDILGGLILSAWLVMLYYSICRSFD
ncbi:MAG: phosphatase PAP2 family protein [Clostridia bacterium]|nr:phosphatase PAP2 family protein [Clostridia bacterium]